VIIGRTAGAEVCGSSFPQLPRLGSRIRCGRQKATRRRWRLDAHPEPSGRLSAKPLPVFLAHITGITWSSFGPATDVTDEALGPR
jgi:hypothetical protein